MNKITAIVFFIIMSINLANLILNGGYSGGKVYVESDTYRIVGTLVIVIILGYLSVKLKW